MIHEFRFPIVTGDKILLVISPFSAQETVHVQTDSNQTHLIFNIHVKITVTLLCAGKHHIFLFTYRFEETLENLMDEHDQFTTLISSISETGSSSNT